MELLAQDVCLLQQVVTGVHHSLLVCVYFVGTEVGSDTMRAERELYLRREETLRDEVTVVGGG